MWASNRHENSLTRNLATQICFFTGAICLLVHPAPAWLNPTLIFVGGLTTIIYPVPRLITGTGVQHINAVDGLRIVLWMRHLKMQK